MAQVIKMHRNEGPLHGLPGNRQTSQAWMVDTSASMYAPAGTGPLLLTTKVKGAVQAYLSLSPYKTFRITGRREVHACLGVCEIRRGDRVRMFSSLDYSHQRHALVDSFGAMPQNSMKIGPHGHRVSVGNGVNHVRSALGWLDGTTPAGMAVNRPRYFVGFLPERRSIVVDQQKDAMWLAPITPDQGRDTISITLQEFYNRYRSAIDNYFAHN